MSQSSVVFIDIQIETVNSSGKYFKYDMWGFLQDTEGENLCIYRNLFLVFHTVIALCSSFKCFIPFQWAPFWYFCLCSCCVFLFLFYCTLLYIVIYFLQLTLHFKDPRLNTGSCTHFKTFLFFKTLYESAARICCFILWILTADFKSS